MNNSKSGSADLHVDRKIADKIKKRIRILVFSSALAVALAFGLSFYFALVYNTSAVASQFPELQPIVNKLKNLLIMNTLTFSAIIIGSFCYLSTLITNRIFNPLESIHKDIISISRDKLPLVEKIQDEIVFSPIQNSFAVMVERLRDREISERDRIRESLGSGQEKSRQILESIIAEKESRSGAETENTSIRTETKDPDDSTIFMQQS